jgi:cell division protein ZapA (FtsZ GTPase activity inhibitor)
MLPQPEKGFLDYQIDLEMSGKQMSAVMDKMNAIMINIGKKSGKHTLKIQKITANTEGQTLVNVSTKVRYVANNIAHDLDDYCRKMNSYNTKFSTISQTVIIAIRWLSEHQPSWTNEKSLADIQSLRDATRDARGSMAGLIEALNHIRGVAATMNAAIDRATAQLVILNDTIDSVTTVCDFVLERANVGVASQAIFTNVAGTSLGLPPSIG